MMPPFRSQPLCLHGFCPESGSNSSGSDSDSDSCAHYPYSKTADRILEQIMLKASQEDGPTGSYLIGLEVWNETWLPLPDSVKQNKNVAKSLRMIGAELLCQTLNGEDLWAMIARCLAVVSLSIEQYSAVFVIEPPPQHREAAHLAAAHGHAEKVFKFECMHGLLRYYTADMPCSCLNRLKELYKECTGTCGYVGCKAVTLDTKLYDCSACKVSSSCFC
jgi:hypothetical protein